MTTIGRANTTTNNQGGIRIPPVLLWILMALLVNFFEARFKQWKTRSALVEESEELPSLAELRAIAAQLNAPTQYSQEDSLTQARNGGGTQVRSHFITDSTILTMLNNAQMWQDCANRKATERWLDRGADPSNLWEELVLQIWNDYPVGTSNRIAGYEYWCNILQPSTPLDWHVDKDEAEYENGNLITPYMGAVWYGFPHEFTGGGHLELFPFHPYTIPDPTAIQGSILQDHVERIRPEYNRLIFLNVSQWHRVAPIRSGTRYTLAVNAWLRKPKAAMTEEEREMQKGGTKIEG